MGVRIDPDGVLAMSGATLGVATTLGDIGRDITREIEHVDQWVEGAPQAQSRTGALAETLALMAGAAREHAVHYVDHERPIEELRSLGYWLPDFGNLLPHGDQTVTENLERIARSDEFGAIPLGTAQALLERYRNFHLYVPRSDTHAGRQALSELDRLFNTSDTVHQGRPYVRRASGLYVPSLSDADPRMPRIHQTIDDATYAPGRQFTTGTSVGRPPTWARNGGRVLGIAGVGLTLWDVGASQWEHDQRYHPEYSTAQRVGSTGYALATEGGGAVAGGLVGAHYGAVLGSFVPIPVVGTLGGALIGGAVGAFIGSKAGKAVGQGLKQAGSAVADGAKKIWNGLFG